MAATVTSTLVVRFQSILANTIGLASGQAALETGMNVSVPSGTGAGQADRIFTDAAKSISAAFDYDLNGSLLDAFGAAFVLARVKAILVIASPLNTGNVIIGNDAASVLLGFGAIAHTWAVKPGGVWFVYSPDAVGWPVTAATADILQFTPSAGTQVFDLAILGASV
jgi:hypothetical protein